MSGEVEEVYSFDREDYAEMINKSYPDSIKDDVNYGYENEGIFMYEHKGKLNPALVQIINNDVFIVLAGMADEEALKRAE
jgi:hypothetical protein